MEFFYSNCFIEAIKAKIKNPKNVKLYYIPRGFNIQHGGHWVWEDKTLDPDGKNFFEFCSIHKKHNPFYFLGTVSPTDKEVIYRMMNVVHARDKKLRRIEKKFGMKFNQGKLDKILETLALFDWQTFDPVFSPLPKLSDAPKPIDFDTKFFAYEPTSLKPKIMGFIQETGQYKLFDFDSEGNVITNGENISWWKWELFKSPEDFLKEWEHVGNN